MSEDEVNGKPFDASVFELADDATAEIEIYDPRGRGDTHTGIYISLLSRDAEKPRALTRAQLNRRFKPMQRARGGGMTLTAEELEAESLELLVACTKSWRGMLWSGQPLPCTAENVRMVYMKSPIIREQVDDAVNNRALFTKS